MNLVVLENLLFNSFMEFVLSSELNSRSDYTKLRNKNVHCPIHNTLHFYAARINLRMPLISTRPFLAVTGSTRITRVELCSVYRRSSCISWIVLKLLIVKGTYTKWNTYRNIYIARNSYRYLGNEEERKNVFLLTKYLCNGPTYFRLVH